MMTVRLIAYTPEPEKVVAAAAKLCYSDAHITDLLDGKLTTHTYLAPYIPAEKIVNIREYDTAALEAALTGGGE